MRLARLLRHLLLPHWWVLRAFPVASLRRIERAIAASESTHQGELRVVVEANLPLPALLHGQSARARAIDLCNAGDPVCSGGDSVPAHRDYGPSGLTNQAAAFVAGLL